MEQAYRVIKNNENIYYIRKCDVINVIDKLNKENDKSTKRTVKIGFNT